MRAQGGGAGLAAGGSTGCSAASVTAEAAVLSVTRLALSRQSPASTSDNSVVPAQKAQDCSLAFEHHSDTAFCLDHQSPCIFMWLALLMWATVDSSDEP